MIKLLKIQLTQKLFCVGLLLSACQSLSAGEMNATAAVTEVTNTPDTIAPTEALIETPTPVATPTQTSVPELTSFKISSPVASVYLGANHCLALLENGEVLGWGSASVLGLSSDREAVELVPSLLPDRTGIKGIFADDWHTLFLDQSGAIHEQGFFERGTSSVFPNIDQVQQVGTSDTDTILALKEDGSVWAWGRGQDGQLGIPELIYAQEFVKVPIENVTQVAFAYGLALAVRSDGTLWTWGKGNLPVTGSEEVYATPQQIPDVHDVQNVALGDGVNILHTDGAVTVWADGEFHPIKNLPPIAQIDGDDQFYNLGVATDGTLWIWGSAWPVRAFEDLQSMPYDRTLGPERFQGHAIDFNFSRSQIEGQDEWG